MLIDSEFHHIGVATKNIEYSQEEYAKLGYATSPVVFDEIQNVHVCFLKKEGMPRIELVMPGSPESPVTNIVEKSGTTPYHICYGVIDIEESVKRLRADGYILLQKPVPARAFDGKRISFLYKRYIGLIELLES